MAVPKYDKFIEPILRYLQVNPQGCAARDAHEAAAKFLGLTDVDMREVLPSGQVTYKNRSAWAHLRLKRAGLSSSPKRGYWRLTVQGTEYAKAHPTPMSTDDVEQLANG